MDDALNSMPVRFEVDANGNLLMHNGNTHMFVGYPTGYNLDQRDGVMRVSFEFVGGTMLTAGITSNLEDPRTHDERMEAIKSILEKAIKEAKLALEKMPIGNPPAEVKSKETVELLVCRQSKAGDCDGIDKSSGDICPHSVAHTRGNKCDAGTCWTSNSSECIPVDQTDSVAWKDSDLYFACSLAERRHCTVGDCSHAIPHTYMGAACDGHSCVVADGTGESRNCFVVPHDRVICPGYKTTCPSDCSHIRPHRHAVNCDLQHTYRSGCGARKKCVPVYFENEQETDKQ